MSGHTHQAVRKGRRVPAGWGAWPTEVCSCGAWRTTEAANGPWRTGTVECNCDEACDCGPIDPTAPGGAR